MRELEFVRHLGEESDGRLASDVADALGRLRVENRNLARDAAVARDEKVGDVERIALREAEPDERLGRHGVWVEEVVRRDPLRNRFLGRSVSAARPVARAAVPLERVGRVVAARKLAEERVAHRCLGRADIRLAVDNRLEVRKGAHHVRDGDSATARRRADKVADSAQAVEIDAPCAASGVERLNRRERARLDFVDGLYALCDQRRVSLVGELQELDGVVPAAGLLELRLRVGSVVEDGGLVHELVAVGLDRKLRVALDGVSPHLHPDSASVGMVDRIRHPVVVADGPRLGGELGVVLRDNAAVAPWRGRKVDVGRELSGADLGEARR